MSWKLPASCNLIGGSFGIGCDIKFTYFILFMVKERIYAIYSFLYFNKTNIKIFSFLK